MATKAKNQPKKPAKKNGYAMPKPLKPGDILNDNQKNQWKIGVSIGIGGFGEIYSACNASSAIKKLDDYPYVVKIEPSENGPLFVEMHFYKRNAKNEDIETFKKNHKLKALGMPAFIASGTNEIENIKHRFIVLPRFGSDIWKIFIEQDHKFPLHTVYRLGWQIINVLEYIHSTTYVHGDIKGSNILLGFGKGGDEQVYLLDFGLACHYNTKEFKPDPKKMHNGTIEYTSRDAHQGVPTMRGDIEILAYNLIEWAGAKLPWVVKKLLAKPVDVQRAKEEFMKGSDKSLKSCFGSLPVPSQLTALFKYLESMKSDTAPDYAKIRGMFEAGLKELGQKNTGKLEFVVTKATAASKKKEKEPAARPFFDSKFDEPPKKKTATDAIPGPSKKEPAAKRNAQRKQYAEVESDSEEENIVKKNVGNVSKPKKAPAKKAAEPKPVSSEEERPAKRNRENKRYVVESGSSEEDEEVAVHVSKSPQKKTKAQGTSKRSTSKENDESSVSPPQKRSKADEGKKEKSSKNDDDKKNNAKGSIVLKSATKSSKNKKTIKLNFNLDVSLDSDLIVVVNRKDKKKKEEDKKSEDAPAPDNVTPNRAGVYKGKQAKAK